MTNSLARLRSALAEKGSPTAFVTDKLNLRWLTGFTGSSGFAIVDADRAVFVTDSRYTIQAQEEIEGFDIRTFAAPKRLHEFLAEIFAEHGIKELAFETSISHSQWSDWKKQHEGITWTPIAPVFADLRKVKTPEEISRIKKACELTDACFENLAGLIQAGRTEFEVQLDLEFFIRRQGAEIAFDPIVVSGENSARPHGSATDKPLEEGDFLTIDMGANLDGYCSDITRTFVIGKASDRHREVYGQVLQALEESKAMMKAGVENKSVDARAREVLDEKGLAQYFGHGLGHGLGLAVHDFGSLSGRSNETMRESEVYTVEPGVYIEGVGGVRVEDDVVVRADGVDVLTAYPRELMGLG